MNVLCIFFGVVFAVSGILFAAGKIHPYIPGWQQMPEEEKRKIRIVPLCRNIGTVILLSGIIFLFKGLLKSFTDPWFTGIMVVWLIAAGADVWLIAKSGRYSESA